MDNERFENLLTLNENDLIDFKVSSYHFGENKADEDAKFVKDILSFGNSVRTDSAFIIAGIRLDGAKKILLGIDNGDMLDDASLQQKIEGKIFPKPKFLSYLFEYSGMLFGIIEIFVHPYPRPLMVTNPLKGCLTGKIYIRRGSSNSEADPDESNAVFKWLEELARKNLPLPKPPSNKKPEPYIPRKVSKIESDPVKMFFREGNNLKDILKENKRVALLGWGLSGKSTELKQLAHELSKDKTLYVFFVPFGNHVDESIEERIAGLERISPDRLVVLLDGLDEVLPEKFEEARRKVSQFVNAHTEATVVVSCRTNFYTTDIDELGFETLTDFVSYKLNDLNKSSIYKYLEKSDPKNKDEFLSEIAKKNLSDLLLTPYYLIKLASQYKTTHKISDSKAALFESEISILIRKEIAKKYTMKHKAKEKQLFDLLSRLAFIMEANGTNEINNDELEEIFPIAREYEAILNAGAIFYTSNTARSIWKFNHNNTQEYLTARLLIALSFKKVKAIMGIGPDYNRVKPSWVNTLSFLNGILSEKESLKKKLTMWLVDHNRDLLITLETEKISKELRFKTFVSIFKDYKNNGRRINHTIYSAENLARFSEQPKSFDFLLKQLNGNKEPSTILNALDIINYFQLKAYPDYQVLFKPHYEGFLFGIDPSLHYLALKGYIANFELSAEEFTKLFSSYKDNKDTYIRFQLFQSIWFTGNQDIFIDYIIEQAKMLIREDRQFSHERKNKTRLSNEYREIAKCLESVKSASALVKLFIGLKAEFVSFSHSTYFSKTIGRIMENAAQHWENAVLNKKIKEIFFENHSYILHDQNLKNAFMGYFNTTDDVILILNNLYKLGFADLSAIYSIATLANVEFIDFLLSEFKNGKISNENLKTTEHFLGTTANPNLVYFRKIFDLPEPKTTAPEDYRNEAANLNKRNLLALFDRKVYLSEIEQIFKGLKKNKITYNDTYSNDRINYWSKEFCEVARDALDLGPRRKEVVWNEVKKEISLNFDDGFIERVYSYLLKHQDAELTAEQIKLLTVWCDGMAANVDFKYAMEMYQPWDWILDLATVMFSFFVRKLSLDKYPIKLYSEMISFIKYDDHLIEIVPFVEKVIGFEKTKQFVLENLRKGITNNRLLDGHLKFVESHKVKEATRFLIQYLVDKGDSEQYAVLRIFLELGGKLRKLKPVLRQSAGYFKEHLIEKFVKTDRHFIRKYLKEQFASEADEEVKLMLSRFLIQMQDVEALKFYISYIEKHEEVPDDSSPSNPLYSLREPKFIQKILYLYQISHIPKFHSDTFKDLSGGSAKSGHWFSSIVATFFGLYCSLDFA